MIYCPLEDINKMYKGNKKQKIQKNCVFNAKRHQIEWNCMSICEKKNCMSIIYNGGHCSNKLLININCFLISTLNQSTKVNNLKKTRRIIEKFLSVRRNRTYVFFLTNKILLVIILEKKFFLIIGN